MRLQEVLDALGYGEEIRVSNGAKELIIGDSNEFSKFYKLKDRIVDSIHPDIAYGEDDGGPEYPILRINLHFEDNEL